MLAENIAQPFDLVLVSCKAYDLASAMLSFAPAVGPSTAILPLLNGMRHLDELDSKFGKSRVLGGQCVIAATLNKEHAIVHLKDMHALTFGERDGGMSERIRAIAAAMQRAKFDVNASDGVDAFEDLHGANSTVAISNMTPWSPVADPTSLTRAEPTQPSPTLKAPVFLAACARSCWD